MGAHVRPQKRISEAKSRGTALPWLFFWRNLFYAEHTPSFGSAQAQRLCFDLSWCLFLRCAAVPARFRFRPFGRACLPLISDAPDCKCSPGRLLFWMHSVRGATIRNMRKIPHARLPRKDDDTFVWPFSPKSTICSFPGFTTRLYISVP